MDPIERDSRKVAAVVYEAGVAVEHLLGAFARHLHYNGWTSVAYVPMSPLDVATRELSRQLQQLENSPVDLVLLSQFPWTRPEDAQTLEVVRALVKSGYNTLTAVRREHAHAWLESVGGSGTLLDARFWILSEWWRTLSLGTSFYVRTSIEWKRNGHEVVSKERDARQNRLYHQGGHHGSR